LGFRESTYHNNYVCFGNRCLSEYSRAVQFGFNPKVINPRISRFTYGVSTNKRFRPRTDPEEKKQIVDHIMYCSESGSSMDSVSMLLDEYMGNMIF
jgi:hypothetical protein